MNKMLITIGCQFGSGGREIGQLLAQQLGKNGALQPICGAF